MKVKKALLISAVVLSGCATAVPTGLKGHEKAVNIFKNPEEAGKVCKPFPENVWGKPENITALLPEVVLSSSGVKVKRMDITRGFESFLVQVDKPFREYLEQEKGKVVADSSGIIERPERFLREAVVGCILSDRHNPCLGLGVLEWIPHRTDYPVSTFVGNNRHSTVIPDRLELIASGIPERTKGHEIVPMPYGGFRGISTGNKPFNIPDMPVFAKEFEKVKELEKGKQVREEAFCISNSPRQVIGNKVAYVRIRNRVVALKTPEALVASADLDKPDRGLFVKFMTASHSGEPLLRIFCYRKEDVEVYLRSKNISDRTTAYMTVCGSDKGIPYFLCYEFKDTICAVGEVFEAEKIGSVLYAGNNYKDLSPVKAEYMAGILEKYLAGR